MLSRIVIAWLWLGGAGLASAAVPSACLGDTAAWPSCLDMPAANTHFPVADPAATLYRQLDVSDESARERSARLEHLSKGNDAQAIIALTQLGWHAAREGKARLFHRPYQQALERQTTDPELDRYRHLSYATACSRLGEIDCALTHWRHAARTAPDGASWLPETWAIALWHADAKDAAIAWYRVAVLNDGALGRSREVANTITYENPMSRLRRDLFNAWSQRFAAETATIKVDIDIDAQGRVTRAQIPTDTNLHPSLRARVQTSVARWRFDPLPEQGDHGTLMTTIEVDVRRHASQDTEAAEFDIQYVRMGMAMPDYDKRKGLRYPKTAAARRAQGVTVLRVLPANDGSVEQIEVVVSSGHPDLDKAAIAAAKTWRFLPPRIDGVALREWIQLPIDFQLSGANSSDGPFPLPAYPRSLQLRRPY